MKDFEVVANKGQGDAKVEVGREKIKIAENGADAISLCGGEDKMVAMVNRQLITNKRNSLARPAGANKAALETYERAAKVKGVTHETALEISGLTEEAYQAAKLVASGGADPKAA